MSIKRILTQNEQTLRTECKPIDFFDKRLHKIIENLEDTLRDSNGVGLAAPQIGVLRRVAVIDLGESFLEMVNPEIIETSGEQRDIEGCLSCPNLWGYVTRPMFCTLKAQNRDGEWYEAKLEGLACRCACHETDHLDGKLFIDLVEEFVKPEDLDEED
jgi:peptide deformylase